MLKKIVNTAQWMRKHWAISTAIILIIATAITSIIFSAAFSEEPSQVPIFVTVQGISEDKDMESVEVMVEEDATIAEIFTGNEQFPKTYIQQTVRRFLGEEPRGGKRFYVSVDDKLCNDLTLADIRNGARVLIEYK